MLKIKKLKNHFIRNIPREIDTGVLYIPMEYATAVHDCCCGCRECSWQVTGVNAKLKQNEKEIN